jgi:hypothetical protein
MSHWKGRKSATEHSKYSTPPCESCRVTPEKPSHFTRTYDHAFPHDRTRTSLSTIRHFAVLSDFHKLHGCRSQAARNLTTQPWAEASGAKAKGADLPKRLQGYAQYGTANPSFAPTSSRCKGKGKTEKKWWGCVQNLTHV